jgi:hypothetical protein
MPQVEAHYRETLLMLRTKHWESRQKQQRARETFTEERSSR